MSQAASGRVAAIGKIQLFETLLGFWERSVLLHPLPGQRHSAYVRCPPQFLNQIHHPIRGLPG